MTYALVQEGKVVSTNLPEVGMLPDGSMVSGFDKLDAPTLREAGWVPIVIPDPPSYNSETQTLTEEFHVEEGQVTIVYSVQELPPPEPEPEPEVSILDRIASLEDEVRGMKERALAATVSNVDAGKIRDAITGNPNA